MRNAKMDLFIVACARDIKLLRHFLLSYRLFFQSEGKIHLLIWRKDKPLLDQIRCPPNLVVHWKDDVVELVEDDFRNQMYLKLISDRYVATEWYWVVDCDYLITAPLHTEDFFVGSRASWFYRAWGGVPEQSWRQGTEKLLGESVPYLFMDAQQYLFNRTVLKQFQASHEVSKILTLSPLASEFIAYGSYAYRHHREKYHWCDIDKDTQSPIAYKVNQRPPSYQVLRDDIVLADSGECQYCVFWSHWDATEEKMLSFFFHAQMRSYADIIYPTEHPAIPLPVSIQDLQHSGLEVVDGQYSDGWTKKVCTFYITPSCEGELQILLEVLPAANTTTVYVSANSPTRSYVLTAGENIINIPISTENKPISLITMRFSGGTKESFEGRQLYARVMRCMFKPSLATSDVF